MLRILRARIQQKHRTMKYPRGNFPEMPDRFAGRPVITGQCGESCRLCLDACPTHAVSKTPEGLRLDLGRCLFCRSCVGVCPSGCIAFTSNHQLAAAKREDLIIGPKSLERAAAVSEIARKFFRRSLKLRQVSAGGCNACEADANVLSTPAWDMGRFGISFVASPRHADGLLVTGPVTENMLLALRKTYEAVPAPRIVIASGACALSGGVFGGNPEVTGGAEPALPVDLFVPGCPRPTL